MSKRTLGFGAFFVVIAVVVGCDGPEMIVPAAPPGVDPRAKLAETKEPADKGAEALGEQVRSASAAPARMTLLDSPPALSTKPGEVKTTASGVKYETLQEGSGAVSKAGQKFLVRYTGSLSDGRVFDGTRDGKPREFNLGVVGNQLITGWNEAIPGMKVGERRKLTIPPNAAYGAQGRPGTIPPNATLIFEIELVGTE